MLSNLGDQLSISLSFLLSRSLHLSFSLTHTHRPTISALAKSSGFCVLCSILVTCMCTGALDMCPPLTRIMRVYTTAIQNIQCRVDQTAGDIVCSHTYGIIHPSSAKPRQSLNKVHSSLHFQQ